MRVTRAALRAQAQDDPAQLIHEDADAHVPQDALDPDADQDVSRPVLKDITHENHPLPEDPFREDPIAPMKKAKTKRKGRQDKKEEENEVQSLDKGVAQPREAVREESDCSDLSLSANTINTGSFSETSSVDPEPNVSHLSLESIDPAAEPAQPLDSASTPSPTRNGPPQTPKFDPSIHRAEKEETRSSADTVEDSFIEKIKTRSPSKMQAYPDPSMSPDSFVDHITSRTPRIEDSVEAMDALEEAIEKVSERLPVLDGLKIESPVKLQKNTPAPINVQPISKTSSTLKKTNRSSVKNHRASPTKAAPATQPASRPKPTTSRAPATKPTTQGLLVTKQGKKPIIDGNKPRESSAPSLPSLSFSNSPVKALPNTTAKRVPSAVLSTSKPGFMPAKSSKPPTKPTFTLPGEAISAKVKAQREERLKREEEAEKEKKLFKARPVPTKISRPSVVPRENKVSQARSSIYANGVNKENVAPRPAPQPKARPVSLSAKPKTDSAKANSGVRRSTSVIEKPTGTKPRVSSLVLTVAQKPSTTAGDAAPQKQKGREAFGRSKAEMERLEKERKEKEESTRKARAEAAERGRQASREWAEKQKKKMALQVAAKAKAADAPAAVA